VTLALLLGVSLAAGCGGSSSSTTAPIPTGIGNIRLEPPGACNPACAGTTLTGVEITGPQPLGPFILNFGRPQTVPFALPGAYTISGGVFVTSASDTAGCPTLPFTVATGLTTTVTWSINNDVCTMGVSGPA
jgi:hypothetical protein